MNQEPSTADGFGPHRGRPASGQLIGPLLRRAQTRAARTFSAALQRLGIEGRHYGVLLNLNLHGPLSQRQLIDRTSGDKSTMVRTVDDLEARGLVERRPSPVDRRAYAVELTVAGRALFADASKVADEVAARLLACFDDDEQAQLVALLTRFADAELPPEATTRPS
jgi:DNA-binding MarR family transcriptional regulator